MRTTLDDFNFTIDIVITDYNNKVAHSWQKACKSKMTAEELLSKIKELCGSDRY